MLLIEIIEKYFCQIIQDKGSVWILEQAGKPNQSPDEADEGPKSQKVKSMVKTQIMFWQ